jgi:hypothetical protein
VQRPTPAAAVASLQLSPHSFASRLRSPPRTQRVLSATLSRSSPRRPRRTTSSGSDSGGAKQGQQQQRRRRRLLSPTSFARKIRSPPRRQSEVDRLLSSPSPRRARVGPQNQSRRPGTPSPPPAGCAARRSQESTEQHLLEFDRWLAAAEAKKQQAKAEVEAHARQQAEGAGRRRRRSSSGGGVSTGGGARSAKAVAWQDTQMAQRYSQCVAAMRRKGAQQQQGFGAEYGLHHTTVGKLSATQIDALMTALTDGVSLPSFSPPRPMIRAAEPLSPVSCTAGAGAGQQPSSSSARQLLGQLEASRDGDGVGHVRHEPGSISSAAQSSLQSVFARSRSPRRRRKGTTAAGSARCQQKQRGGRQQRDDAGDQLVDNQRPSPRRSCSTEAQRQAARRAWLQSKRRQAQEARAHAAKQQQQPPPASTPAPAPARRRAVAQARRLPPSKQKHGQAAGGVEQRHRTGSQRTSDGQPSDTPTVSPRRVRRQPPTSPRRQDGTTPRDITVSRKLRTTAGAPSSAASSGRASSACTDSSSTVDSVAGTSTPSAAAAEVSQQQQQQRRQQREAAHDDAGAAAGAAAVRSPVRSPRSGGSGGRVRIRRVSATLEGLEEALQGLSADVEAAAAAATAATAAGSGMAASNSATTADTCAAVATVARLEEEQRGQEEEEEPNGEKGEEEEEEEEEEEGGPDAPAETANAVQRSDQAVGAVVGDDPAIVVVSEVEMEVDPFAEMAAMLSLPELRSEPKPAESDALGGPSSQPAADVDAYENFLNSF